MAADPVKTFLQGLQKSRLLSSEQWKTVREIAREGRKQNGGSEESSGTRGGGELQYLVSELLKQRLLTQWQAAQLKKGQTGFVLGSYRLLHPVGRGGMGHVFKANRFDSHDEVAVKVMARKLTSNESLVSRFQREIKASSRLNSPHIVKTVDAGRVGKVDFMVMEFVNGDQIDEIANQANTLPVGLACEIARHAAIGLQHAHEQQMVHRDIKPSNLIVNWNPDGNGTVKLMDMGLVMVLGDDSEHQMTRTGQVMGTPDYMSPEQGWDTTSVDIRGDIYSLGCSLYRLLTGTTPFTGTNPLQVLSQRLQRDAPSITSVDSTLPEDVAAVVSRMTRRDPDQRYQTPAEVAEALAPFCQPLTLTALSGASTLGTTDSEMSLQETKIVDTASDLDEGDVTYQQFLQEVDRGTGVDLIGLGNTPQLLESDIPIVQTEPTSALDKTRQRRNKRKRTPSSPSIKGAAQTNAASTGQTSGRWKAILGGAIAAVAITAIVVLSNSEGENDAADNGEAVAKTIQSIVRFEDTETTPATLGRLFQYQPEVEIEQAEGTEIFFQLNQSPHIGLGIDEETAQISWLVPRDQPLQPIQLTVEAVEDRNGTETVIATHEIEFDVQVDAASVSMQIPEAREMQVIPDVAFSTSVAVPDQFHETLQIRYQLLSPKDSSAKIDEQTGELTWVPTRDDVGIQKFELTATNAQTGDLLDQQTLTVLVLPDSIDDLIHPPEILTASPGEDIVFELGRLSVVGRPRGPARFILEIAGGSPAGATILGRDNVFRWTVPDDASGLIQIPLQASIRTAFGNRSLAGTMPLKIQIKDTEVMAEKNVPSEDVLQPLREELRKTHERRLSKARSQSDKASLGRSLLLTSMESEVGPSDFALLDVIDEDLARPARSYDLQLEIAEQKAKRYGLNELDAISEILQSFSRRNVPTSERDRVTERLLRLALLSAQDNRFELTGDILEDVRTLLPRSSGGLTKELTSDIKQASEVVKALSTNDTATEVQGMKSEELIRLLSNWQFEPVFQKSSAIRWFQSSGNAISTSELQQMWEINDDTITLNASQAQALVGFVDGSLSTDRFSFRCQLLPGSNAAQLIVGLDPDVPNRPPGLVISVDSANPGRIQSLADGKVAAAPTTANLSAFRANQPNELEVNVDGPRIIVRLNGTVLNQVTLPSSMPGLPGLGADLKAANPTVKIRSPRILTFP